MGFLSFLQDLFSRKEYGIPSTTINGEHVRSRAEQRIADYFTRNNIRYVYEKEIQNGLIFKHTFARPDFYLPDYDVCVEYWGLVDASSSYRRYMKKKMAQYHRSHIKFISLYPRNMDNLDWIFRAKLKEVTGSTLTSKPQMIETRYCPLCGRRVEPSDKFCAMCGSKLA